jgi:hypothetical protein
VIRFSPAGVTLLQRLGYPLSNWTTPTAILIFPGKPITLPRRADDSLRVLIDSVMSFERILFLNLRITAADSERIEFISPNATLKDFLAPAMASKYHVPFRFTIGTE